MVHPNPGGGFSWSALKEDRRKEQDQQSRAMKVRGRVAALSTLEKLERFTRKVLYIMSN